MSPLSILFVVISLGFLAGGMFLLRLTGSRQILISALAGSLGLLSTAFLAQSPGRNFNVFIIPFLVGMLLLGRAIGTWWRSRQDHELWLPCAVMFAMGGASLAASWLAYSSL